MAKEKDHTKTILIIGGLALGTYVLTRPSVKEKLQEGMSGYFPQFSFAPMDLTLPGLPGLEGLLAQLNECVGGSCIPGGLIPDLNIPGGGLGDLFGGIDEIVDRLKGQDGSSQLPGEHATLLDVAYSLPSWSAGIVGVGATALAGYGGYHLIRAFSPALRAMGIQAARGIGGAGTILKNLISRSVALKVSGQVIKSVPMATTAARTGIGAGILGGILPALAFTGILEGGYQIFRTMKGEQNIGMTGVPPIDIINLITGRAKLGGGTEPIPTLLFPQFGIAEASAIGQPPALGGSPATVMPLTTQPQLVAGKTTPLAVQLPELQFPAYTGGQTGGVSQGTFVTGPPPEVIISKMLAQE